MKKIAILCAEGLGDGLLMMVAASRFADAGYQVTLYHNQKNVLSPLFPIYNLSLFPDLASFATHFLAYDIILVQNDNSAKAWRILELRSKNLLPYAIFLFPTPCKASTENDFVFDPKKPFLMNLKCFLESYLKMDLISLDNGIALSKNHKQPMLVAIHPTSKDPLRNWNKDKFLKLAKNLEKKGYSVAFTMSKEEREHWPESIHEKQFPKLLSFYETAVFLSKASYFIGNDSGLGHLASSLGIPTLTISGNPKRVRLWRPAWSFGSVVTIPFELPNFKGIGFRIRDYFWQNLISVRKVEKAFEHLVLSSSKECI